VSSLWFVYIDWTTEEVPRAFYVGKGCKKRVQTRERNEYWKRIANKYGWRREVIMSTKDEQFVFEQEVAWIATMGTYHYDRDDGWGCNFTRGGEGPSGYHHDDVAKKRISETHKGRERSSVWCGNISVAKLGEKNPQAKLTSSIVQSIRVRYAATAHLPQRHPEKVTMDHLAFEFGMTRSGICRVISGGGWP
jgi:hypothetical protein